MVGENMIKCLSLTVHVGIVDPLCMWLTLHIDENRAASLPSFTNDRNRGLAKTTLSRLLQSNRGKW